jgi:hypothetical protein
VPDSYEVDVPESAGPVIRATPGGEQPVELPVEDGKITTDSEHIARAVSAALPDAGPVRMVPADQPEPVEADFTEMVDDEYDEAQSTEDGAINDSVLPEDRKDEPDQPAEPDTTTRSARRGR